jgi:hypothetical protein
VASELALLLLTSGEMVDRQCEHLIEFISTQLEASMHRYTTEELEAGKS